MKLYLTRHAESTYNVRQLLNSDIHVDVPLTETGRSQAQKLAVAFKNIHFDKVYVSELARTQETAAIICNGRQVKIITDPRLNENITGYEGQPTADWRHAMDLSGDMWNVTFNGGESLHQAYSRVQEFYSEIVASEDGSILIVAHGFAIQAIYGQIMNKTYDESWRYFIAQGEFVEFDLGRLK